MGGSGINAISWLVHAQPSEKCSGLPPPKMWLTGDDTALRVYTHNPHEHTYAHIAGVLCLCRSVIVRFSFFARLFAPHTDTRAHASNKAANSRTTKFSAHYYDIIMLLNANASMSKGRAKRAAREEASVVWITQAVAPASAHSCKVENCPTDPDVFSTTLSKSL